MTERELDELLASRRMLQDYLFKAMLPSEATPAASPAPGAAKAPPPATGPLSTPATP